MMNIEGIVDEISTISRDVQRSLSAERGERYSKAMIEDALTDLVAEKLELLRRDLRETFTSPGTQEFRALSKELDTRSVKEKTRKLESSIERAKEYGDESVFTGNRIFSKRKMAAMIKYLTASGHNVYKTSLNKLLFYSDLTSYFLSGNGISGAAYLNRPYGPVADQAASLLTELVAADDVKVDPRMQTLSSEDVATEELTADEMKVLDWVAKTYGGMGAGEVSEYSHSEMAYRNTRANEPIAYAYAQFLKQLPPKDLLSS